jgi:DNA-nicking Smr family endonuclease
MPDRPLPAEEAALWARVAATVTPLAAAAPASVRCEPVADLPQASRPAAVPDQPEPGGKEQRRLRPSRAAAAKPAPPTDTLDGGWDRRLRRGVVVPDRSIDLHGHTLATAQTALEQALAQAVADGARVLLVVTGKPPRERDGRRGLIRASIFDWLGHSRHAAHIAAVRNAHPRHGGLGALYLILRRRRGE